MEPMHLVRGSSPAGNGQSALLRRIRGSRATSLKHGLAVKDAERDDDAVPDDQQDRRRRPAGEKPSTDPSSIARYPATMTRMPDAQDHEVFPCEREVLVVKRFVLLFFPRLERLCHGVCSGFWNAPSSKKKPSVGGNAGLDHVSYNSQGRNCRKGQCHNLYNSVSLSSLILTYLPFVPARDLRTCCEPGSPRPRSERSGRPAWPGLRYVSQR